MDKQQAADGLSWSWHGTPLDGLNNEMTTAGNRRQMNKKTREPFSAEKILFILRKIKDRSLVFGP